MSFQIIINKKPCTQVKGAGEERVTWRVFFKAEIKIVNLNEDHHQQKKLLIPTCP